MKILDTHWFINGGIVRVFDEFEGIKYYVRGLQVGEWSTPEKDAEYIGNWGSTFPKAAGDVLFGVDELRNGNAVQIPMNKEQAELMIRVGTLFLDVK